VGIEGGIARWLARYRGLA